MGPLPTMEKLIKAQTNDMLRQNLKKVLRKDGTVIVSEKKLLSRKASADTAIHIIVPNATEGQHFTISTAKNWLDIREKKEFMMCSREHTAGPTWPQKYTNSFKCESNRGHRL